MKMELQKGNAMSAAKATIQRPPLPPFTRETAIQKVRLAEDAWNSRDPEKVALAYTVDSRWRNRSEFVNGRQEIVAFLRRKWTKELDYRLIKELWRSRETVSPCALRMNGTMTPGIGFARMAMRIGSSMRTG
jgi:nuclear transport factor 2 (NTF2) superfamily protein